MSQEQTPNTPKADTNNHTTTDHNTIPTTAQGETGPLLSSGLSPSANPDFPRRSSSLQPSSPGAPSSKTNDTSLHQPSDSMGEGDAGNEGRLGDSLSGEGQGLDGSGTNDMENAKEKIEEFDWDGLEERFWAKMEECQKVEEGIMEEFGELIEVFNAWTTAGAVDEEQRAAKRLRTRMAFVQQKEENLEEKRVHYTKVVKAFESALALLSGVLMQMRFDPALLMENCTPPVNLDVKDLESDTAASPPWGRLAEEQLAREQLAEEEQQLLAAQLPILEESASSGATMATMATPLDLVEHTHTLDCYHGDLVQASTYHPNRCSIL